MIREAEVTIECKLDSFDSQVTVKVWDECRREYMEMQEKIETFHSHPRHSHPVSDRSREADLERQRTERGVKKLRYPLDDYLLNLPEAANHQDVLLPPTSPECNSETVDVLQNAEKLVNEARQQIMELTCNVMTDSFVENSDKYVAHPAIDDNLLYVRRIVESKFRESNDLNKIKDDIPARRFDSTSKLSQCESYDAKGSNDIFARPTSISARNAEPREKKVDKEADSQRVQPDYGKTGGRIDSSDSRRVSAFTNDAFSWTRKNVSVQPTLSKVAKKSESMKKVEADLPNSNFQVQIGPKIDIRGDLTIQKVEDVHIPPNSSAAPIYKNVATYNFRHESFARTRPVEPEHILRADKVNDNRKVTRIRMSDREELISIKDVDDKNGVNKLSVDLSNLKHAVSPHQNSTNNCVPASVNSEMSRDRSNLIDKDAVKNLSGSWNTCETNNNDTESSDHRNMILSRIPNIAGDSDEMGSEKQTEAIRGDKEADANQREIKEYRVHPASCKATVQEDGDCSRRRTRDSEYREKLNEALETITMIGKHRIDVDENDSPLKSSTQEHGAVAATNNACENVDGLSDLECFGRILEKFCKLMTRPEDSRREGNLVKDLLGQQATTNTNSDNKIGMKSSEGKICKNTIDQLVETQLSVLLSNLNEAFSTPVEDNHSLREKLNTPGRSDHKITQHDERNFAESQHEGNLLAAEKECDSVFQQYSHPEVTLLNPEYDLENLILTPPCMSDIDSVQKKYRESMVTIIQGTDRLSQLILRHHTTNGLTCSFDRGLPSLICNLPAHACTQNLPSASAAVPLDVPQNSISKPLEKMTAFGLESKKKNTSLPLKNNCLFSNVEMSSNVGQRPRSNILPCDEESQSGILEKNAGSSITKTNILDAETLANYEKRQSIINNSIADGMHIVTICEGESLVADNCRPPTTLTAIIVPESLENNQIFVSANDRPDQSSANAGRKMDESKNFENLPRKYRNFTTTCDGKSTKLNPQSILNIRDVETTDSIDDQIFELGSTENIGLMSSDLNGVSMIRNSTLSGEETNLQMLGKMIGSIQHSLSFSLSHQGVSSKELNDEEKEFGTTVATEMVVERDCTLVTENHTKHDSCKDNLATQRTVTPDESRNDTKVQSSISVKATNYGRNSESCASLSHDGKIKNVSTEDNDEVQTYSFRKQPTDETRSISNREEGEKIVECNRLETPTRSSNKSIYSSKNENCTTFANYNAAVHGSSCVKYPTASSCKEDNPLRNVEHKSEGIELDNAQERLEKQSQTNKCQQNHNSVISNFEKNGSEGNTDEDISFVIPHDADNVIEAPNTSGVYKIRIDIRNKDRADDTQVCTNIVTRDRCDSASCTRRADSKLMNRKSRFHDAQISLNKNGKFSKRPNSLIDALIETQIQKDTNTTNSGASERTSMAHESIKVGTSDRKKLNRMLPPKLKDNSKSLLKKAENQSKNSGRKTAEQNKNNSKKSADRQKNSGKKTIDQSKSSEKKGRLQSKNTSDNNKLSFNNGKRAITRIVKKIDIKASDETNMKRFCSICKQVYGTCRCISFRKCLACTTMEKRVKVPSELKTDNKLPANFLRHDTKRGNADSPFVLPKKPALAVEISPPSCVSKTLEACTNTEIIPCLCGENSLMTNAGTSMNDDQRFSVTMNEISNVETRMQPACREVETNTINVRRVSFAESNVTKIRESPQILPNLSRFCENSLCMTKSTASCNVPEATIHSEYLTLDATVAANVENHSYEGDKTENLAKSKQYLMMESLIERVSSKQPTSDEPQNLSGTNVVMCSNIFKEDEIVTLQPLKEPANKSHMTKMMSVANYELNCMCELQVEELVCCNGGAEESTDINESSIRVCMDRDDRVIQDSVCQEKVPATESMTRRPVSSVETGTQLNQKNDLGCTLFSNNAQIELSLATSLPKVSNASCCTECMKRDMDVGKAGTMTDFSSDPMDRMILCINDDATCSHTLLYNTDLQCEKECTADCAKYRPLVEPANGSAQIISMNRPHSVFVNQDLTPLPSTDDYWRDEELSGSNACAETRIRIKRVQYDDLPKNVYPTAGNTNTSVASNIVQGVARDHSSSSSPAPKLWQAELPRPENLTTSQLNEGYPLSHDSNGTLKASDSAKVKKQVHLAHQDSTASVKREDQLDEPNDADKHAEIIKNYTNNLGDYRDKYKEILNRKRLKSNNDSSGPTKNSTSVPSNLQISESSQVRKPHKQIELVECNESCLKLDPRNHEIIDYTKYGSVNEHDLLTASKYTQAGMSNIGATEMRTSETITRPISNERSGRPLIMEYSLSYTMLEIERDGLRENKNMSSKKRSRRKPVNNSHATKYSTTPQIIEYFSGKRKLEDMEISYADETDSSEEHDTGRTSNATFNFSTGNIMKSLELCMIHENAEQILTSKIWNETGSIDSCGSACSKCWEHASSDTYSEGEINLPSSCSYSLGEVRMSESSSTSGGKNFRDHDGLRIYMTKSLLDSIQTTYSSPGQIRTDIQATETVFSSSIS